MPVRVERAIVARGDAIDADGANVQPDEIQVKRTELGHRVEPDVCRTLHEPNESNHNQVGIGRLTRTPLIPPQQ